MGRSMLRQYDAMLSTCCWRKCWRRRKNPVFVRFWAGTDPEGETGTRTGARHPPKRLAGIVTLSHRGKLREVGTGAGHAQTEKNNNGIKPQNRGLTSFFLLRCIYILGSACRSGAAGVRDVQALDIMRDGGGGHACGGGRPCSACRGRCSHEHYPCFVVIIFSFTAVKQRRRTTIGHGVRNHVPP